jgi:hypothetical protein
LPSLLHSFDYQQWPVFGPVFGPAISNGGAQKDGYQLKAGGFTVRLNGLTGPKRMFGFNFIDFLFIQACLWIGEPLGFYLASGSPHLLQVAAAILCPICLYLALVYPFYYGLKRYPMTHPRCACCGQWQQEFFVNAADWPRVVYRCPSCDGEFAVWHNGRAGAKETWENPVLALTWPYAFGVYRRLKEPEPGTD